MSSSASQGSSSYDQDHNHNRHHDLYPNEDVYSDDNSIQQMTIEQDQREAIYDNEGEYDDNDGENDRSVGNSQEEGSISIANESSEYDSSTTTSAAPISVDQAQLDIVKEHLLKSNATFLAPRAVVNTPDTNDKDANANKGVSLTGTMRQTFMRRFNIFATTVLPPPDEESVETNDQLDTIATDELQGMSLQDKRAYFEMRKLRDLPRNSRHLFWEERSDHYSYYPLPELAKPQIEDQQADDSASYTTSSSYSTYSHDQSSHLPSASHSLVSGLTSANRQHKEPKPTHPPAAFRTAAKRDAVVGASNHEIQIIQHIQAEKKKAFLQNCILSAHGVRVLPSFWKRPQYPPHIASLDEQHEEDERNRMENADWGQDREGNLDLGQSSPIYKRLRFRVENSPGEVSAKSPGDANSMYAGSPPRSSFRYGSSPSPSKGTDSSATHLPAIHSPSSPNRNRRGTRKVHHEPNDVEPVPSRPLISRSPGKYSYKDDQMKGALSPILPLPTASRPSTGYMSTPPSRGGFSDGSSSGINSEGHTLFYHNDDKVLSAPNSTKKIDDGSIGSLINIRTIRGAFNNAWM